MMRDESTRSNGDSTGLMADFLSQVPGHLEGSVERVLDREDGTREELISALESYTTEIDAAARGRRDLDVDLAEAIRQVLLGLLEADWPDLSEDQRRLVRLAFAYYVDAEDGDGDLDSVFGFDDDAAILNLVLHVIGRPELEVRI